MPAVPRFFRLVVGLCMLSSGTLPAIGQDESAHLPAERVALFDYDQEADLQLEVVSTEVRDGAIVQDVAFVPIFGEDPVKAYIVTPSVQFESYPGILWGHWLGGRNANRNQFLQEAIALAREGIVSVLVDTMWSDPAWYGRRTANFDEDFEIGVDQVICFRRAMDLLVQQPDIDPERIAFVGHDYSGMYGMPAFAVDGRASAYVFIAVAPSFYDWAFFRGEPQDKAAYFAENDALEPMEYLPFIQGDILFQFAANDFYVPLERRNLVLQNAISTHEVEIYETAQHSMDDREIAADRDAWLREVFGMKAQSAN